jgi:hypothetical protein
MRSRLRRQNEVLEVVTASKLGRTSQFGSFGRWKLIKSTALNSTQRVVQGWVGWCECQWDLFFGDSHCNLLVITNKKQFPKFLWELGWLSMSRMCGLDVCIQDYIAIWPLWYLTVCDTPPHILVESTFSPHVVQGLHLQSTSSPSLVHPHSPPLHST